MTQKLQIIKNQAFALAKSLGLHCTQTTHFKKRRLTVGLDLQTKRGWLVLCDKQSLLAKRDRLKELATGVLVPFLCQQPIAA